MLRPRTLGPVGFGLLCTLLVACAANDEADDTESATGAIRLPACATEVDVSLNGGGTVRKVVCPKPGAHPLELRFENARSDAYDVMLQVRVTKDSVVGGLDALRMAKLSASDAAGLQVEPWQLLENSAFVYFGVLVRHAERSKGTLRASFVLPSGVAVGDAEAFAMPLGGRDDACSLEKSARACYAGSCEESTASTLMFHTRVCR